MLSTDSSITSPEWGIFLENYVWDLQVKEKSQLTRTGNKPGVEGISITRITPETTNVKPLTQRTQANGYYDAELKVIVLGRNMNTMTLPHEMAHFWIAKNHTAQMGGAGRGNTCKTRTRT